MCAACLIGQVTPCRVHGAGHPCPEVGPGVDSATPKVCKTTPGPTLLSTLPDALAAWLPWEMGEGWEMINVSVC